MKKIIIAVFVLLVANTVIAQTYFTRSGSVTFESEAPLEKIEASNQKATSVLDTESGKIEFAILIKAFQFEKALMQEHFNENYMESDQFPKALFKGKIVDPSIVDYSKDGTYAIQVTGELTIHGETKNITTPAELIIKDGAISGKAMFEVAVADYKIEIPAVVKDNIAKIVKINIDVEYELYKKKS